MKQILDLHKLFCCFRKVYIFYDYMDNWQIFRKNFLLNIENFYNNLNLDSISNSDYKHTKRVWSTNNMTNLVG